MRTERFKELHPVELQEDERQLRGRQAARQAIAIKHHKDETKRLTDEWNEQKKGRKTDEETMTSDLFKTSRAAEEGREDRWVECEEALVGAVVITRRLDTGETVGSRNANRDELHGNDKPKASGGKLEPPKPEEKAAKLERLLIDRCAKQFAESAVIKAVLKDAPEATAAEVKAQISRLVEAGRLVESDGKLLAVHPRSAADDGIVDDTYDPHAPTH